MKGALLLVISLASILIFAACTAGATPPPASPPTPTPTATPTPMATPTPTLTPTPTPCSHQIGSFWVLDLRQLPSDNLLGNGSFEQINGEVATGWRFIERGGKIVLCPDAADGEWALQITTFSDQDISYAVSDFFPVEPGEPYYLSLKAKSKHGFLYTGNAFPSCYAVIEWGDNDTPLEDTRDQIPMLYTLDSYKRLTRRLEALPNANSARIAIVVKGKVQGVAETILTVDDISLIG